MTIFYSHATFKKENYKNKTTSSPYPFHFQSALIQILSIIFCSCRIAPNSDHARGEVAPVSITPDN